MARVCGGMHSREEENADKKSLPFQERPRESYGRVPAAVRAPRRYHKHHMNTIIGTGRMSMQGEPDTDSPALSAWIMHYRAPAIYLALSELFFALTGRIFCDCFRMAGWTASFF